MQKRGFTKVPRLPRQINSTCEYDRYDQLSELGLGTSSCIQAIVITERKRILLASTNLHTVGKNTHSWVVCVIMILRWRNIGSMYQCVTYSRRRSEDDTLTGVLIHFASELETLRFSPDPYASYAVSHFGSFGSNGKL